MWCGGRTETEKKTETGQKEGNRTEEREQDRRGATITDEIGSNATLSYVGLNELMPPSIHPSLARSNFKRINPI